MRALETLVIYVTSFLIIGFAAKLLMKRRGIDLSDIQAQAGPNRKAQGVPLGCLTQGRVRPPQLATSL
jgi:hypothetical protein